MVFVIGGGNYIEYQNLLDNAKVKQLRLFLLIIIQFLTISDLAYNQGQIR
jgi:hypothetical protein